MTLRPFVIAVGVMAGLSLQSATAAPGVAKGSVNLRTGPGTNYARIVTIPAGAPVNVLRCGRWCEVIYAGRRGWASASYIARGAVVRRGYFALPDQSLCHGPEAWSIPWCETPIERSANDFANSTRNFQMRQGGKR
jgi:uncharacterized protein YraI